MTHSAGHAADHAITPPPDVLVAVPSALPARGGLIVRLRDLVQARQLIRFLVSSTIRTEHSQTVLGFLWWILDPLLMMLVYYVLIHIVLRRGGPNYPLFVFSAIIAWRYFTTGVGTSMSLTSSKISLMKRAQFPKAVLPIAAILSQSVRFLFGLAIFLPFAALSGLPPTPLFPLVFLVMAIEGVFALALAFFFAAANVFVRDVQNAAVYAFRTWFYLSPALYASSRIPARFKQIYDLNPFAVIFPAYRRIMLDGQLPDFAALGWVALLSFALLAAGYAFFVRLESGFTKVA